jgi:hypothetical protein
MLTSAITRYSLGGVLFIETTDAPAHFGEWLQSDVGMRVVQDGGPADLRIVFEETLGTTPFQRLDVNGSTFGFDANDFFMVDKRGGRARLNLDELAEGAELVCERRWAIDESIVRDILALLALGKGWLLLHGSAFEYNGIGVLVTGWQSSGKSEFLLGMRGHARFVSDEPTLVNASTRRIIPSPALLPLWDWQIAQLGCEGALLPGHRRRVRLARGLGLALPMVRGDGMAGRTAARVRRRLKALTRLPVPPGRIFPLVAENEMVQAGIVITGSIGSSAIRPMSGLTLAKRMQLSQQYERRTLTERYQQFRHVFPDRRSQLLDSAPERELALLTALFRDLQVRELVHPYPGKLTEHGAQARQAVLDAMAPTQHASAQER